MKVSKDDVLAWLDEHNLSREYLAEQCGVGVNAVNNWLGKNAKRKIPAKAVLIIENLMRASEEQHMSEHDVPQNLVLEFTNEEFDAICSAAADAGELPRQWAKQAVLDAVRSVRPAEITDFSYVAEDTSTEYGESTDQPEPAGIYALPFVGAAAAGEPVEAAREGETVIVEKLYDAYHYVAEVNGESMQPTLMDGERIIFETKDKFSPANGKICVIQDAHGNSIKRYDRKKNAYVSDNPAYPDFTAVGEVKLLGYFVEKV